MLEDGISASQVSVCMGLLLKWGSCKNVDDSAGLSGAGGGGRPEWGEDQGSGLLKSSQGMSVLLVRLHTLSS